MVGELCFSNPHSSDDTGDSHGRCALDVIVEGEVFVLVLLQQPESIGVGEILELYQCALTEPMGK